MVKRAMEEGHGGHLDLHNHRNKIQIKTAEQWSSICPVKCDWIGFRWSTWPLKREQSTAYERGMRKVAEVTTLEMLRVNRNCFQVKSSFIICLLLPAPFVFVVAVVAPRFLPFVPF